MRDDVGIVPCGGDEGAARGIHVKKIGANFYRKG